MIRLLIMLVALQSPVRHVSNGSVEVYYPAAVKESIARDYLATTCELYTADTAKFKMSHDVGLKVRLCRDAYEFSDLTGADSIFSPLWQSGTLYILNQGDPDDVSYKCVLEAGVIKALLDPLRQNGAPLWLINSAAVYESGEYQNCPTPVVENVDYFADLNEKIQSASSPTELANLCFYLGATGKFFDLRFGVGSLLNLLQEFQHETNFDDAIEKIFHVDRTQLESDWRDFLTKEGASK
jgi:hypothetical protein